MVLLPTLAVRLPYEPALLSDNAGEDLPLPGPRDGGRSWRGEAPREEAGEAVLEDRADKARSYDNNTYIHVLS